MINLSRKPKFRKGDIVFVDIRGHSLKNNIGTIVNFRFDSFYTEGRPVKIIEEFRYEILIDNSLRYFFEPELKEIT